MMAWAGTTLKLLRGTTSAQLFMCPVTLRRMADAPRAASVFSGHCQTGWPYARESRLWKKKSSKSSTSSFSGVLSCCSNERLIKSARAFTRSFMSCSVYLVKPRDVTASSSDLPETKVFEDRAPKRTRSRWRIAMASSAFTPSNPERKYSEDLPWKILGPSWMPSSDGVREEFLPTDRSVWSVWLETPRSLDGSKCSTFFHAATSNGSWVSSSMSVSAFFLVLAGVAGVFSPAPLPA
mmetsp:Transcript_3193/g.7394  ORF Transcript_3193/g.7394 Transcript_3193/m.7394 type:complete len:237 (-) Transcript_3193:124-834(-)